MSGTTSRLGRLEPLRLRQPGGWPPDVVRYAAAWADLHGLSVDDVLAEAGAVMAEAGSALRPLPRFVAFVAAKDGLDPAAVLAEAEGAL